VQEAFLAYCKLLSRNFRGGSPRNYKRLASIAGIRAEFQQSTLRRIIDELTSFKRYVNLSVVTQYAKNAQENVEQ
jgi:hypothetical protein